VASGVNSASRLGQSGPLTGQQLFNKINCTLAQFGQEQVDAPPAGTKVFVSVSLFVNGWEDRPVTFAAIVPASA
jgi:hypothetical protein